MFNQRGAANFVRSMSRSMLNTADVLENGASPHHRPGAIRSDEQGARSVFKFIFWPVFIWSKLKWRMPTEQLMLSVPLITLGIYSAGVLTSGLLGANYFRADEETWSSALLIHLGTTIGFWIVMGTFYFVRGTFRAIRNGSRGLSRWVRGR
jgi:hypothetical protein